MILTENLHARTWGTRYLTSGRGVDNTINTEYDGGVVYDRVWEPDNGVVLTDPNTTPPSPWPPMINALQQYSFPRPSSRHPGGVNSYFGDGHATFVSETMEYLIYQHLMTPYGKKAGTISATVMNPAPTLPNLRTDIYDPGEGP
jgi:prepilin-type processing-associated H-X9-DG protein